jgi:hypothetical protein
MSKELLRSLCGSWHGTCQTWFEPEMLADTAEVTGTIELVMNGKFVRFVYDSSIQGQPRTGEELLAFNSINQHFEVSWIDSFHMSDAILFSQGPAIDGGFEVVGAYEVGAGLPAWGWRTRYERLAIDQIRITAFNIMPGEEEAKALETILKKVG